MDNSENLLSSEDILESIGDGVYVTDLERRIVYWNKACERITGWRREDVLGLSCMDDILCHVDKANRKLCGKDTCPLFRAIITGKSAMVPVTVYARHKEGDRLPMQVNVAPIRNETGRIIGGVEVFRDISNVMNDLARAKKIQMQALKWGIRKNADLDASMHYIPHDMIGGDYYAVERLSSRKYVFLLADVMGHGTSAALYTMYLRSLWEEHFGLFPDVAGFFKTVNEQLHQLMHGDFSFAAGVGGFIDMDERTLTLAGGSFPTPFIFHQDAFVQQIDISGFALGMVKDADFPAQTVEFGPGDLLFLYTDGAIENSGRDGEILGEEGLMTILQKLGYPRKRSMHQQIEEEIIQHSANG